MATPRFRSSFGIWFPQLWPLSYPSDQPEVTFGLRPSLLKDGDWLWHLQPHVSGAWSTGACSCQPPNSGSSQTYVLSFWTQIDAILSCIMFGYNKNMGSLSAMEFGKFSSIFLFLFPLSFDSGYMKGWREMWQGLEMLTPFRVTSPTV